MAGSIDLTFTPTGNQTMCVSVEISDDDIYEETEFFFVDLSTDDQCVDFRIERKVIEIEDDDCEQKSSVCSKDQTANCLKYIYIYIYTYSM